MDLSQRRGMPGLAYPEEYLRRLAGELTERFDGIFGAETIERYVLESYTALLRTSTVTTHLASRTVRFATDRLTALAQARGDVPSDVVEILFVCEQNAGRSQMAAVLTNHAGAGRVHVRSAGSAPSAEIHETVSVVLAERGLDVAEEFPKPLTDDVVQAANVVITMGCGDACAIYPGKRYEDWTVADPSGASLDEVRAIRDDIARRVDALLASVLPA
jgi:arsenate reductase (thioredoxin)